MILCISIDVASVPTCLIAGYDNDSSKHTTGQSRPFMHRDSCYIWVIDITVHYILFVTDPSPHLHLFSRARVSFVIPRFAFTLPLSNPNSNSPSNPLHFRKPFFSHLCVILYELREEHCEWCFVYLCGDVWGN